MDADALIIRTRTTCDRELLEGTSLRFIATATIGFDHIDTVYCRSAGIQWANAPGCNSSSVEQYVVSALLHLAGKDQKELAGMTLGVIGAGHVGSKVIRAALTLGMNVLVNDPPRERTEGKEGFTDLSRLLEGSDVVTLHVPLNREGTDRTCHMAGKAFFSRMKDRSVLINTSRGPVVDQAELLEAIDSGILRSTVLDVYEDEPNVDVKLLHKITFGTPHIAGYSIDGKAGGTTMAVRAVSRFFQLGRDHWKPDSLPEPAHPVLTADSSAGGLQEIIRKIYLSTYDVSADDRSLRSDPAAFERLRGEYPIRREPHAYGVRLRGNDPAIRAGLSGLGFRIADEKI